MSNRAMTMHGIPYHIACLLSWWAADRGLVEFFPSDGSHLLAIAKLPDDELLTIPDFGPASLRKFRRIYPRPNDGN